VRIRDFPGHALSRAERNTASYHLRTRAFARHYQYTAIDHGTRIRVLRIYPRNGQKNGYPVLRPRAKRTRHRTAFMRAVSWPSRLQV
jgi:hypothetical protein